MSEIDLEQVAILMRERRQRAEAFRQRHEVTFPALFKADDHHARGGPKDVLIREIETACQKRPDGIRQGGGAVHFVTLPLQEGHRRPAPPGALDQGLRFILPLAMLLGASLIG